jgi:phosphoglycerol transferase MdoB-like AlkP superfamily enzyme
MANTNSTSSSGTASVAGLLGVAFVVLKLTHVIDWSWWWVLAPFWIPFMAFLLFLTGIVVVAVAKVAPWQKGRR